MRVNGYWVECLIGSQTVEEIKVIMELLPITFELENWWVKLLLDVYIVMINVGLFVKIITFYENIFNILS